MHDYEGENEETAHYAQQYFCDEETLYDTGDPEGNRFLQETTAGTEQTTAQRKTEGHRFVSFAVKCHPL